MKKTKFFMKRLSFMLMAAVLPLVGAAQRVSLPYGYAARGGMSYCPNTYLPSWMAAEPEQEWQDATFLIANPSFEEGLGSWSGTPNIMGETGNKYASQSGKFDVSQELTNIPNGVYELSVNGFYEGEKSRREAYVYAGMEAYALKSKSEGNNDLWSTYYSSTVRAVVINNKLKIGVKGIYSTTHATSFDNFSLKYLGSYVVGFAAEIAENYGIGATPTWTADDRVAVHINGNVYKYKAVSVGSNTTTLVVTDNNNQFPQLSSTYTAVRPYTAGTADGNLILPTSQKYGDGIDPDIPMVASMENGTLSFKNVCGLLKLNLKGNNSDVSVKTITVTTTNGKKLSGTYTFDAYGNLTLSSGGNDNVKLSSETNIPLNPTNATTFYIALPPDTYDGLTVTVTDGEEGNECIIELGERAITRSSVTNIENQVVAYGSVSWTPASIVLGMDADDYKTKTITATVVPSNKQITVTSSNESIVKVTPNTPVNGVTTCTVTAQAFGTATIIATINGTDISSTCVVNVAPAGAIPGLFSVSAEGDPIYFSKGNLWYGKVGNATTATWNFENSQYDYRNRVGQAWCIGGTYEATGTPADNWGSFGWSTNAENNNNGMSTSEEDGVYSGDFVDWGNNAISNGGNMGGHWRTLTGNESGEWDYLINGRKTAGKVTYSYAKVTVNFIKGLMLFPDGFDFDNWPTNAGEAPTEGYDVTNALFTYTYTTDQFGVLEKLGVVFLPCNDNDEHMGQNGRYWSSTFYNDTRAYGLSFHSDEVNVLLSGGRSHGNAVRLVFKPVPATSVTLDNTTMNLSAGGTGDLMATVDPTNTTDVVTWTSSNTSVATVDSNGHVTAVAGGTATITVRVGDQTATCTVNVMPAGAIPGQFTVNNNGKKVYFSKGNLRYNKSQTPSKWEFYENQYGHEDSYSTTKLSLFCWGWSGGSVNPDDYTFNSSFNDWGAQQTVIAGIGSGWYTLSKDEWNYLLKTRTIPIGGNCYDNKSSGITIDGQMYKGLFIYPDGYSDSRVGDGGLSTWTDINAAGIVFLPCAGQRWKNTVNSVDSNGNYWSSSKFAPNTTSYGLLFDSGNCNTAYQSIELGSSVRLVHN